MKSFAFLIVIGVLVFAVVQAQETPKVVKTCSPATLDGVNADPNSQYLCGLYYQKLALEAGYVPDKRTVNRMLELVLQVTDVKTVIAASSVGADVDIALEQITQLGGDSFTGELLFKGIEVGLDGNALGCAGCHNGETAPGVAGTWTRVDEIRLQDPLLAEYTIEQYLVESILHPNTYIVPDYLPNIMPDNFHSRLDAQELADLVAYLSSQDQFLDELGGG